MTSAELTSIVACFFLLRTLTLLPCSVGVVQVLTIRFCAVGKEGWEKVDDDKQMNVMKRNV
jgi:hypothetical protein